MQAYICDAVLAGKKTAIAHALVQYEAGGLFTSRTSAIAGARAALQTAAAWTPARVVDKSWRAEKVKRMGSKHKRRAIEKNNSSNLFHHAASLALQMVVAQTSWPNRENATTCS